MIFFIVLLLYIYFNYIIYTDYLIIPIFRDFSLTIPKIFGTLSEFIRIIFILKINGFAQFSEKNNKIIFQLKYITQAVDIAVSVLNYFRVFALIYFREFFF